MGVYRTDYLMLGVDVGYDAFDYDRHGAESDGEPERRFDIVYDGMCGGYCVAGKIIASGDQYEGFGMTKIDPAKLDINRDDLAAKLSEAFGKTVAADELALLLFSDFS
ncbi:hypothetical protein ACC782_33885 [Rhizobium ruizarguesonis]